MQINQYPNITTLANSDLLLIQTASDNAYKNIAFTAMQSLLISNITPKWIYKNANYTANAGDQIVADASSGSFTITLPSSPSNGTAVIIALTKNNSSNSNIVSVVASSGLSPYASIYINIPSEITLVYLSSTWQIIGTYNGVYPVGTFPVTPRYRFSASLQSGFVNGSSVGSISDSSSNNFAGTASGTAQPTFQTNVINGYPALLFNGSTNYITLGNSQVIADPGDFVIFQVVKYSASGGVSFGGGNSTSGNWGLAMEQGGDYAVAGGSQVSISLTMSLNTWYIKAFSRIGNVWKSWVNGGANISGGSNSGALRGVSSGYESIDVIGAFWNGSASNFTNGYIAETAIISSPTLANINSIGAYYSSMYGITWNTAS